MADDKETKFVLSADTREFLKKMTEAKESVSSLSEAKNLDGLVNGLLKVGAVAGVLGAAFFAVKAAFDTVFDVEHIKQINAQFEALGQGAGLATGKLKEGLIEAGRGLVDDTELLKSANKAIVSLGDRAARLPEIMELARKTTAVFGGDLQANFEQLNTAIANGNTRMLKHLGLKVDLKKAEEDYAKSIGATVGTLSAAGKQEAAMNAVLEAGQKRFKGVNEDILEANNTWQQLKVTITQISETIAVAFEKILGPTVRSFLKQLKESASGFKDFLIANIGEGSEQSAAKVKLLERQIAGIKDRLANPSKLDLWEKPARLEEDLKRLQAEYDQLTTAIKAKQAEEDKANKKTEKKEDRIDRDKEARERLEVERMLLAARKDAVEANAQISATYTDQLSVTKEREIIIEQEAVLQRQKIEQDYKDGKIRDLQSVAEMEFLIEETKNARLEKLRRDQEGDIQAAEDRYIQSAKDEAEATARAAEVGANRATRASLDYSKQAKANMDSLRKHSIDAFMAIGEGSKDAGEAAKGFFFNIIADRAEAEGQLLLATSIWPPNPLGLAAGGALIALAGFLRSQSKSSSSASSSAGSGAGGLGATGSFGTRTDERPSLEEQKPMKAVNITVQGSYFETEQTKTALVDLIRQNQDATDYKIIDIGGGI